MNEILIKQTIGRWLQAVLGTQQVFNILFSGPFVEGNIINATFDGIAIDSVLFTTDSNTTLQALANAIFKCYQIFSCYVDGNIPNQLDLVGTYGAGSFSSEVTVTGGASQPTSTINITQAGSIVTVVEGNRNYPRPPAYPFAEVRLGPVQFKGLEETRVDDPNNNIVEYGGQCRQSVTIDYYQATPPDGTLSSPMQPLQAARMSIWSTTVTRIFLQNGIAIQQREPVQNISAMLNTKFEQHSQLVFWIGYADSFTDNIGVIESVEISGIFNKGESDEIDIAPFTVSVNS